MRENERGVCGEAEMDLFIGGLFRGRHPDWVLAVQGT